MIMNTILFDVWRIFSFTFNFIIQLSRSRALFRPAMEFGICGATADVSDYAGGWLHRMTSRVVGRVCRLGNHLRTCSEFSQLWKLGSQEKTSNKPYHTIHFEKRISSQDGAPRSGLRFSRNVAKRNMYMQPMLASSSAWNYSGIVFEGLI